MSFENQSFGPEETKKIKLVIDAIIDNMQEIEDRRLSSKDMAKTLAEELNIKPAFVMDAAKKSFKPTLDEDKEKLTIVEELMVAAGRA